MADEPSIDEILASLDRLLNEGEGRNDEPTDRSDRIPAGQSAPEPTAESVAQSTEKPAEEVVAEPVEARVDARVDESVEAPGPGFFTALDHAVSEPYNEARGDEPSLADDVPARERAAAEAGQSAVAPAGVKRIVLTDAMLVKDVQQSLPLGMDGTAEIEPAGQASGPAGNIPAAEGVGWNGQDIQALVDQVTDDVCSAMSEQLPEMIRKALAHRLSAFIDVRMRHQDSGPEE